MSQEIELLDDEILENEEGAAIIYQFVIHVDNILLRLEIWSSMIPIPDSSINKILIWMENKMNICNIN